MENNLVFVFGTLKKGEENHCFLEGAEYVDIAETVSKYYFVEMCKIPFVLCMKTYYNVSIKGEVYVVDEDILDELDYLEEHPYMNRRKEINIKIQKIKVLCWCYFLNVKFYSEDKAIIIKNGVWQTNKKLIL